MAQFKHTMEIFSFLNKSNCQKCGKKTCLAFAADVFQGEKTIEQCPFVDDGVILKYGTSQDRHNSIQENREIFMEEMRKKMLFVDLEEAAGRTGGKFDGHKLTIKILGKNFSIDRNGSIYTTIHINPWIAAPFFSYILQSKGVSLSGKWVSFRELKQGRERYPLFRQRCESAMKRVADIYTDLFHDMVHVLNGKEVAREFQSDISVVMHVLPRIPVMICYWAPDEGLESTLNIYFDETSDQNLDIESLFSIGAGLTRMFTKIAQTHGFEVK